jgi:transposase-like protein
MIMKEAEPENLRLTKSGRKIPLEVRAKILSESLEPGCVISDLAGLYGISARIIYRWRHKEKQKLVHAQAAATCSTNNFIELPLLCNSEEAPHASSNNNSSTKLKCTANDSIDGNLARAGLALSKASLVFEDLALNVTLEGRVKSDLLAAIVKILEEESC